MATFDPFEDLQRPGQTVWLRRDPYLLAMTVLEVNEHGAVLAFRHKPELDNAIWIGVDTDELLAARASGDYSGRDDVTWVGRAVWASRLIVVLDEAPDE